MAYCSLVKVDSRLGAAWRWCFARLVRRALAWRMDTKEAALCHADKSARNEKRLARLAMTKNAKSGF
ncbi:hypothetical protein [Helicobacter canis]|uniref:hypothetical protein n=1 Tax=Helicobacter canis TaxID=29419 RepID=UPI0011C06502|nr:hypothetical protein [Helicobacter canis]